MGNENEIHPIEALNRIIDSIVEVEKSLKIESLLKYFIEYIELTIRRIKEALK